MSRTTHPESARNATPPSAGAGRREQRRLLAQDLGRAQLLDAAEEVFGRKGFHDTTLKEIAELAEFSVGSVYSFFENKEDLYLQVFLRRGAEFLPGMEAAVAAGGSPLEQLHRLVDFEVGFFRAHPAFGRLYLRSAATVVPTSEPADSEALSERFRAAMRIQADVFARGQAAGELRDGDPDVLSRLFSGLVSAYQSMDPAVVGDSPGAGGADGVGAGAEAGAGAPDGAGAGPGAGGADGSGAEERLPLAELHAIVEAAFARPAGRRTGRGR
jgi:AcrR family transcriptional regulator